MGRRLVFLLYFSLLSNAEWDVYLSGDTFSVVLNQTSQWSGTAYNQSLWNGAVDFYTSASSQENLLDAGVANIPFNISDPSQVGAVLTFGSCYQVTLANMMPYVVYIIPPSVYCFPSIPSADNNFTCVDYSSGTPLAQFVPTGGLLASTPKAHVTINPLTTLSSGQQYDLLAIAAVNVNYQAKFINGIEACEAANDDKDKDTMLALGFIFFFVAVDMSLTGFIVATWQTWLWPGFRKWPLLWWTLLVVVFVHLLSWTGGVGGWIAALSAIGLYGVSLPITYAIVRHRARRRMSKVDVSSGTKATPSSEIVLTKADEEARSPDGRMAKRPAFTRYPSELGRYQKILLIAFTTAILLMILLIALIFVLWEQQPYTLMDRMRKVRITEFAPIYVSKSASSIYAFPHLATILRFNWFLKIQTGLCGTLYNRVLSTDANKQADIQVAYIQKYSIDMSIFSRTSYSQYTSVNDWFARTLAPGVRPIAGPTNPRVLISSADCRLSVFPTIEKAQQVWLKGDIFTLDTLLTPEFSADFAGGAMLILRLAPADYHRCHSPMSGTVIAQKEVQSTIYSVNAEAVRSRNEVLYNHRIIQILSDGVRKVAYVAIGAQCVGSILMEASVGQNVTKGQDFSYFQFGGSTVVQVFAAGSMIFDDDLVAASSNSVEMLVQMGQKIGTWTM